MLSLCIVHVCMVLAAGQGWGLLTVLHMSGPDLSLSGRLLAASGHQHWFELSSLEATFPSAFSGQCKELRFHAGKLLMQCCQLRCPYSSLAPPRVVETNLWESMQYLLQGQLAGAVTNLSRS